MMAGLKKMGTLGSSKPSVAPQAKPPPATEAAGRPATALARPTLFPQGPRVLGLGVRKSRGTGGPGLKPEKFPGTQPEWVWYFASARYHKDPKDARVGPYVGGLEGKWQFADPIAAGVTSAREVGGTTPDFIYFAPTGEVIVRIEGFYWHTSAPPAQQARDLYVSLNIGTTATRVETVEDAEIMHDPTGAAAVAVLADILAHRSRVGAIRGGIALPPLYDPEVQ